MLCHSLIVCLLFEIRIQFVRVVTAVRFEFNIVCLIDRYSLQQNHRILLVNSFSVKSSHYQILLTELTKLV